jgi:acyl-CoA synthetase (AMP-forming)/AMP-acid ligase II
MSDAKPTIQSCFNDTLERRADRPAIGFANIKGEIDWLTTAGFHRESARQAAWLRGIGLEQGDTAVLVTGDQRVAATTVCGILQLGALPLLVAPPAIQGVNSNLENIIRHVIGLTAARLVLLPPEMKPAAPAIAAQYPGTIPLFGSPGDDIEAPAEPTIVVRRPARRRRCS